MPKPFLLTLEYPQDIGGVAKYLEGEVKNFGGEVVVVKAQSMMWQLWPNWMPLVWRARVRFRREHCDGLWVSHVLPIGYVALVWKWLFKTPYRLYVHGLDLVRPARSCWKKFWARRVLLSADEIVANSKATANLLANYGISPSCVRVQYPRINPPLPDLSPVALAKGEGGWENRGQQLRQKYGIGAKPLLLTISRLVKRKGIDLVLAALPAVWREIPDLVYVIVGDGEERERLSVIATPSEARGKQSNNRDKDTLFTKKVNRVVQIASSRPSAMLQVAPRNGINIILTGPLSEQKKYGWLATCDCFILTPINDLNDFEGYGIVYKEAQIFGKPVIASRVGGAPEAVGDKGILIEPGNVEEIAKAIIMSLRPHPARRVGEAI